MREASIETWSIAGSQVRSRWRLSTHVLYALAGLGVAAAGPALLLLLRMIEAGQFSASVLRAELAEDVNAYLLLAVSAAITFSAIGLLIGRQIERLSHLSSTDPLTGLANLRAFEERLGAELARAMRFNQPLAVLLLDVDRLKEINDRYGHASGDSALRHVAHAIERELRTVDLAARRSGDEFAILAPGSDHHTGKVLASRVLARIATPRPGAKPPRVTASVGVVEFRAGGQRPTSVAALLRDGDEALYAAKRAGRNTVRAKTG